MECVGVGVCVDCVGVGMCVECVDVGMCVDCVGVGVCVECVGVGVQVVCVTWCVCAPCRLSPDSLGRQGGLSRAPPLGPRAALLPQLLDELRS